MYELWTPERVHCGASRGGFGRGGDQRHFVRASAVPAIVLFLYSSTRIRMYPVPVIFGSVILSCNYYGLYFFFLPRMGRS